MCARLVLPLVILLLSATATTAQTNWRDHGSICSWKTACMKEQAHAADLWKHKNWDKDLKRSCQSHITLYRRDYKAALECVQVKQEQRDETLNKTPTKKKYRTPGGRVLSGGRVISY